MQIFLSITMTALFMFSLFSGWMNYKFMVGEMSIRQPVTEVGRIFAEGEE